MLSGDNGILQKATTAKENTDSAQIKERIQLAYYSALAGGQGSYTYDTLMKELENEFETDYDVDDSDSDNWVLSAKGQSVTIPAGTKVIEAYFASEIFETNGNTAKKMHIGDYVNFDVDYNNLFTNNAGDADKPDNIYAGKWRVLYVTSDKLKIVSAGVPTRFSVNGSTSSDLMLILSGGLLYSGGPSGTNCGIMKANEFKDSLGNSVNDRYKGGAIDGGPMALTRSDMMTSMAMMGYRGDLVDFEYGLLAVPANGNYAQLWLGDKWGPKYPNYIDNDGTANVCNDDDKAMETLGIRPTVNLKSTVKYSLKNTDSNGVSTWDIINE